MTSFYYSWMAQLSTLPPPPTVQALFSFHLPLLTQLSTFSTDVKKAVVLKVPRFEVQAISKTVVVVACCGHFGCG